MRRLARWALSIALGFALAALLGGLVALWAHSEQGAQAGTARSTVAVQWPVSGLWGGPPRPAFSALPAPAAAGTPDGGGGAVSASPSPAVRTTYGSGAVGKPGSLPASPATAPTSLTVEEKQAIVAEHFPEQADFAWDVVLCESGASRRAVGSAGERGAFQVHPLHGPVPDDFEGQVKQARDLYERYGWVIWSCKP